MSKPVVPLTEEEGNLFHEAQWTKEKALTHNGVYYEFVEQVDEGEGRWLAHELYVFKTPEGDLYGLRADRGLTENQWCTPFEHMLDSEIGLYPVRAIQTVTYEVDE